MEKKAGQASTILIQAEISASQMQVAARKVWGKSSAGSIREIIFESGGSLVRIARPK